MESDLDRKVRFARTAIGDAMAEWVLPMVRTDPRQALAAAREALDAQAAEIERLTRELKKLSQYAAADAASERLRG